jgi:hypothetical protein
VSRYDQAQAPDLVTCHCHSTAIRTHSRLASPSLLLCHTLTLLLARCTYSSCHHPRRPFRPLVAHFTTKYPHPHNTHHPHTTLLIVETHGSLGPTRILDTPHPHTRTPHPHPVLIDAGRRANTSTLSHISPHLIFCSTHPSPFPLHPRNTDHVSRSPPLCASALGTPPPRYLSQLSLPRGP